MTINKLIGFKVREQEYFVNYTGKFQHMGFEAVIQQSGFKSLLSSLKNM